MSVERFSSSIKHRNAPRLGTSDIFQKILSGHRIQYILRATPSPAGHRHAKSTVANMRMVVGISINNKRHT
jgi:hypothetical protein